MNRGDLTRTCSSTAHPYVVFTILNTWGWVVQIIGIIQVIAAFSIWAGNEFGRWIGIIGATFSAFASLSSIDAYPLWALCLFAVDILVIYGLVAYGGHAGRRATERRTA